MGAELAIIPAVIAAMGGILKLVLNYLDRSDARQEAAQAEMRAGFEKFLGNHMSQMTRALDNLVRSTEQNTDRLEKTVEANTAELHALRAELRGRRQR